MLESIKANACSRTLILLILPCLVVPLTAGATDTVTPTGQVGLTSYITMPFMSQVYAPSFGSSPFLTPGELFWQKGTWFTNPNTMAASLNAAKSLTSQALVPSSGAQRWQDTYEISLPLSEFPQEPSYFSQDRNSGEASGPEFQAWAAWLQARPSLFILANDGGSVPPNYRAWGSSYGYVSMLMPLAKSDCPPDMQSTGCVYGDLYAYQWGQTAGLSGAYGVILSDFSDSQPYAISSQQGFNPEIIAAFAAAKNLQVPAGTIAQKAAWIVANAQVQWDDFLAQGYSHFFAQMALRMGAATNHQALLIDQCGNWPSIRRYNGIDMRIIKQYVSPNNYMCIWDNETLQLGRVGIDPAYAVGGVAVAAAREPDTRNGEEMEALDSAYTAAVAYFYPSLDAADQAEKGAKLLKRSWMEMSWAHIATRAGTVRRALAFISRDYWDGGSLDPTLQTLVQSIYPVAPFGLAVYYSTAAEQILEARNDVTYYDPQDLFNFKNAGVPVGYYVSDAALPKLTNAAKPSAWFIADRAQLIPAVEMLKLKEIAPIVTSLAQVQALPNAPLAFTGGMTGTGFYDQNGRLIITATNLANNPVSGFLKLKTLVDGAYSMLDLFTNASSSFTVLNGAASVPITVTRWDTRALAITRTGN